MKIQSPPGMRDFYPEDMRLQNWLFDAWRRAALAFGFSEYEGPIFEYLDLYTLKSGEAIVSELFTFQDRGQRNFAIRPEMTPTLARMVAARANTLPRPIKWFSIPRMCRAEKPQRGRLREFFQWNVDILGTEDPLADAEVVAVAVAFFKEIGLSGDDIVIRINDRIFAGAMLSSFGMGSQSFEEAFELIDCFDRLTLDEFVQSWDQRFGSVVSARTICEFLGTQNPTETYARVSERVDASVRERFVDFRLRLEQLGIDDFCQFDLGVVRGLAYYTGCVFEAHARRPGTRALMGGGRYDSLTALLDGPEVPAVGFGMGDAPVLALLELLGKLPELHADLDAYVIDADRKLFPEALRLVASLRQANLRVDFSYKRIGVAKQFKQAAARAARYAIVIGQEFVDRHELTVKNLSTGEQQAVPAERLRANPRATLDSI